MAIELKLSKSDSGTPWGFRLVGGIDFDQPVVVAKVNENSLAEEAGLEVGDIIVRINNTPTAGLTHCETHDLLLSAGLEFELGIRRDAIATRIICDEEYDVELADSLKQIVETDIIEEAVAKVEGVINKDSGREEKSICIAENLAGQEEIVNTTTVQNTTEIKQGKKWSTFLIKPDKPVPKSKRQIKEEKLKKDEPYRVVIKKQQRRPSQVKKVQFDSHVIEVDEEIETEDVQELPHLEMTEHKELDDLEVEVTETKTLTVEDSESEEVEDENERETSVKKNSLELADIKVDGNIEPSLSLEEQLQAVQKQLQALSQLPSAIQVTLDAVARQLATIVGAKEHSDKNEEEEGNSSRSRTEEDEPPTEEEILEGSSMSDEAEAEINQLASDDNNSSIAEELEEDFIRGEVVSDEKREDCEEDQDDDPYYSTTEEEKEEKTREEQSLAKQVRAMDGRPPRPIQRPIILPGGRKWSNPEDAIPNFRKPKMSDEKIVEVIDSNLEVITGRTKGLTIGIRYGPGPIELSQSAGIVEKFGCVHSGMIHYNTRIMPLVLEFSVSRTVGRCPAGAIAAKHINFLKYQPPPKNLDYLQRSEVYRLVHDMEPPVRGITSRAEKVLAVQDYYEATNGTP